MKKIFKSIFVVLAVPIIIILSAIFWYYYSQNSQKTNYNSSISCPEVLSSPEYDINNRDFEKEYFDRSYNWKYHKKGNCIYMGVDEGSMLSYMERYELIEVDPDTFEVLDKHSLIKDKNGIYSGKRKLNISDPESFKLISKYSCYGKDKKNIYYLFGNEIKIITEAHSKTFTDKSFKVRVGMAPSTACYAEDKNNKFKYEKVIEDWDRDYVLHKEQKSKIKFIFELIKFW